MRFLAALVLAAAPGFSADTTLPLFFFPNTGQTDSSIQYIVQTPDLLAGFRADGASFQANGKQIRLRFLGAKPTVLIAGLEPLAAKINFFNGTSGWKTDVPSYSKIIYLELYPGIDVTYSGTGNRLKSEFLVAARANPNLIRLEYSEPVSIDADGNLIAGDVFREAAPEIYQQIGASRVKIAGRYRLLDAYTAGFEIGSYDTSAPLVIDPAISYCSYLGGSNITAITGVAVDSSANLYVTGWTEALDFPINGAIQAANQGGVDAFVAKLNPAGTALLYATYIGGSKDDRSAAIAVDNLGQAYITGSTSSPNFPVVAWSRATFGGSTTVFVSKLSAAGNSLIYSGYLGGTSYEVGTAIAVDTSYNVYLAGDTQSPNFPVINPTQATIGGGIDAFITKLKPTGAIAFSTFLGGSGNEHAGGIAVDSLGNIFVAGGTFSTNFPVVAALQGTSAGAQNAFVTKISSAGTVAFSTYLGGSGGLPQQANAIALDSAGNPYIVGATTSANFPVTAGTFQTALNGQQNAFLTKLTANGNAFVYSTYLGGVVQDWATGVAISAAGNAYVSGYTSSVNFPQVGAVQSFGGLSDAFVSEMNFAGNGLIFSTFYGGSGLDAASAIALDSSANIFIGGQTSSVDLHLVTPIQSTSAASNTGWILRLGVTAPPPTTPSVTSVSPTSGSGNAVTFTGTFGDTGGGAAVSSAALLLNTSASTSSGCDISYNPATNLFSIYNDAGTAVLATVAPGGAIIQNDQCSLNGTGSSASVAGNTLTVVYVLTFQPSFPGAKTVYLLAADSSSSTGWVAEGTFTVTIPTGQPLVESVTPNANSGSGTTFTFVYGDTTAALNLTSVAFLFNTSATFSSACYVVWDVMHSTITLFADNGTSSSSVPLGSSTNLQNSQCVVAGGATSAQSGLSLILTISITFKGGAFTGLKNIYMYAAAGAMNTGWVQEGTYSVANGGLPQATSAVPSSGSGAGERFTFILTDPGGASFLKSGAILFASTFNTLNACYLIWDGTAGTISLTYDNPANGQTPFPPGANGIATNEQCTMNALNSTVIVSATQVLITLDLTFNSTFFGLKNIYLYAAEAAVNSGWNTVGTWTVTGGASSAISVSPASGTGSSPTFLFTVSDSSSQTNLSGMTMLITSGAPTGVTNACYLVYARSVSSASIGLWDNTATTLTTKGIGSSTTLQNSQCAVGYTFTSISGNSLTLSIQLVFNTFSGAKSIYLNAKEPNSSSGFVYVGSWTVP
jgi:hypothetical protein